MSGTIGGQGAAFLSSAIKALATEKGIIQNLVYNEMRWENSTDKKEAEDYTDNITSIIQTTIDEINEYNFFEGEID